MINLASLSLESDMRVHVHPHVCEGNTFMTKFSLPAYTGPHNSASLATARGVV